MYKVIMAIISLIEEPQPGGIGRISRRLEAVITAMRTSIFLDLQGQYLSTCRLPR